MQKSVKDLKGYAIGATDGDIGKVDDFYFDDESWTIRYLVADTGNWLLGRKVLHLAFRGRQGGFIRGAAQRDADKEASRGEPQHRYRQAGFPPARGILPRLLRLPLLLERPLFVGRDVLILGSQWPIKKELKNGAWSEKKRAICICAALLK